MNLLYVVVCTLHVMSCTGVCQRDVTQQFPALAGEADDLEETILEFFEEHIQHKFPDPDCKIPVDALEMTAGFMHVCMSRQLVAHKSGKHHY